jgi:hypothetical protein
VIVLAAICLLTVYIGVVPTLIFGHDNFFFLENGWRTLNGLRPHLDYWSPWGPVMFLLVAFGLKLGNASPNAIGYGSALFGLIIGLLRRAACRRSLPAGLVAVGVVACDGL